MRFIFFSTHVHFAGFLPVEKCDDFYYKRELGYTKCHHRYLLRVSTECVETKAVEREWLLEENANMNIAVLAV